MAMKVLMIDNFDSFTFNLVQYLGELGAEVVVLRSDEVDLAGMKASPPDRLVISPGPGKPEDAQVSVEAVQQLGHLVPILGVCLGFQTIVVACGGEVGPAPEPRHGKTSPITHDEKGLFEGLDNPFVATRYHSLMATTLPAELEACAWSEDQVVQGIRHRDWPVSGVQFHPESILTEVGHELLHRFLHLYP